jgi:pullulanase
VFRGDLDGSAPGFAAGGGADKDALIRALTGSTTSGGFASSPSESINYVSAHDNLTLFDRLEKSISDDAGLRKALRLSCAAVLLSQGVPFLEGGPELGRTKGGNGNSYNAGDAVNEFDWERGARFRDVSTYLAGLIAVRKAEPGLRIRTAAEIRRRIRFNEVRRDYVNLTIDESALGGSHTRLIVTLNASKTAQTIPLPQGKWQVLIDGDHASERSGRTVEHAGTAAPMAASVFAR